MVVAHTLLFRLYSVLNKENIENGVNYSQTVLTALRWVIVNHVVQPHISHLSLLRCISSTSSPTDLKWVGEPDYSSTYPSESVSWLILLAAYSVGVS